MKLFFCFLILISSISSFSNEKIKEEILDDIVTKISGYKNISIDFDLLYENISLDIKTNKKGKLILENVQNKENKSKRKIILELRETKSVFFISVFLSTNFLNLSSILSKIL